MSGVVTAHAAYLALRAARIGHRRPGLLDLAAGAVGLAIVATLAASAIASMATSGGSVDVAPWLPGLVSAAAAVALVVAAIGAGGRGGPLHLEAAMVFLVLQAPIDRGVVLRLPALRQVVLGVVAGAVMATVVAIAVAPTQATARLGSWLAAGVLIGAMVPGLSLVVAGLRLPPLAWMAARAIVAAWVAVDLALDVVTSPVSALARLPWHDLSAAAIAYPAAVTLALVVAGVERVGHLSIEKAWRRSQGTDRVRVAIGLNDLRTAVLLLRRRSSEAPRSRPWLALPAAPGRGGPVFRRGARGVLRWPAGRVARFLLLAVATAVSVYAAAVLPPLWIIAVVLAFVAGLDAVDTLAEELDHPDLLRGYPIAPGSFLARHLAVPMLLTLGFTCVAGATASALSGSRHVAVLAAALAVPGAVAVVAGAALTASREARPLTRLTDIGLPVEVAGPRIVLRVLAPLVPIGARVIPPVTVLHGGAGLGSALLAVVPGLVIAAGTITWVVGGDPRGRSRSSRGRRGGTRGSTSRAAAR